MQRKKCRDRLTKDLTCCLPEDRVDVTRLEQAEATGKVVEQISRSKRTVGFDAAWDEPRSVSRFSRPWNNCSSGGQVQGNGQQ